MGQKIGVKCCGKWVKCGNKAGYNVVVKVVKGDKMGCKRGVNFVDKGGNLRL